MNEMDFDVELVGEKGKTAIARVVCVPVNGKDLYYLTSLPREQFTPFDVAEIYAVRWEVELFFKHLKGGVRLDEVRRLSNLHSLRAITYSSLLASLLSHEIIIAASLQLEPEIADTPPEIKQAIDEKEQKEPPPAAFSP